MKSLVSRILLVAISLSFAPAIFAETGSTQSDIATPITIESPLLIENITPIDDLHVDLVFNQDILKESVRVRIAKQSDESNIRIDSFTGGEDNRTVVISLVEALAPDTAYKMTVISAISQDGIIIKDGADALKEFTTPSDLKKFAPVLNAPDNPNAVLIATGTNTDITPTLTPVTNNTGSSSPSETAQELPPTGSSSSLIIVLAAILAGFILAFYRKRTL